MLSTVKDRLDRRDDEGFTLIELMVVVLIIAILLAIAIPTFLGARGQANSRAVQSSLRNALTAEQTYYSNNQEFNDTSTTDPATNTVPSIATIEPNLTWNKSTTLPSTTQNPNSIYATVGTVSTSWDTVVLQAEGKDGNCYNVYQTNGQAGTAATGYSVTKGACKAYTISSTAATVAPGSASSNINTSGGTGGVAPTAWYSAW